MVISCSQPLCKRLSRTCSLCLESNGSSVGSKEDNDGVFSSVMFGVDLSEGRFFARTLCLLCAKKSSSEEAGDGPGHRCPALWSIFAPTDIPDGDVNSPILL